ncbi:inositol-phosphate transport system permease protein [Caldalkalibacillus uzonensis]|uniref:Inositol-phosphate transport system permease protein n=1 Tax=Caldalkalibacillus uzonensis TaxID=353224 RepID=A0ABU0CQ66_9BACI|nr:sugar ABC transporter permease [Caldalkalibacillus uzonensis]MDQ0338559.1 inositol-phosphate transport system permease protein [Caldalkalibacillus uzonensis]
MDKAQRFAVNMQKWGLPAFMLSPFFIMVTIFYFLPVVLIVVLSFTSMGSAMRWDFVGFQNYRFLLEDPTLPAILTNTFVYVFFTLGINVLFGLALALFTTYFIQKESIGLFFRTIWMLPRMSPPVVYVLLWLWFFDPSSYGVLNSIRELMGMPPTMWLVNYPMTAIILANGLIGASFGMIIFSSAIKSIPQDLFKAAKVDGAGHWSIIKDIILPALRWPVMFVTIWQLLSLLTSYEYILLLTNGGPGFDSTVLALYSYHKAFQYFEFGYGAAVSVVLVAVAIVLTVILWKVFGMKKMERGTRIE